MGKQIFLELEPSLVWQWQISTTAPKAGVSATSILLDSKMSTLKNKIPISSSRQARGGRGLAAPLESMYALDYIEWDWLVCFSV
jgi:hypothetical protein